MIKIYLKIWLKKLIQETFCVGDTAFKSLLKDMLLSEKNIKNKKEDLGIKACVMLVPENVTVTLNGVHCEIEEREFASLVSKR